METARLSGKGHIHIPKAIRELYGWKAGIEFMIKSSDNCITLTPVRPFRKTGMDDVLGCVNYRGPAKTLKDMEEAIAEGVKSHDLG